MTIPDAKFELTMRKKFVVALATSLVLANGTSTAFAANVSNSDNSGSATTVPAPRDKSKLTDDQRAAQKALERAAKDADIAARHQDLISFKAELSAYLLKRAEINKVYKTALVNAGKTFNTALKSATSNPARKVARDAFLSAGKIARQNFQDALKALGAPPAKPVKP